MALARHDLGIGAGDVVELHQVNRHEHVVADTASLLLRAVPTSFYNTSSMSSSRRWRAPSRRATRAGAGREVKKHVLLPDESSPESGELTPTMRLERRVIHDLHAEELSALFQDA